MNKKLIISALAVMVVVFTCNVSNAADETTVNKQIDNIPAKHRAFAPEFTSETPAFGMHHRHHHMMPPPSPEEMAKKKLEFENRLKLTEEQKKQIEENKIKDREKVKPIFDKMQAKKQELKALKADTTLSEQEKAIKHGELRNEMRELKSQMRAAHVENMKNFEAVLTDKQKKEFSKIKEEQKKDMEKRKKDFRKKMKKGDFRHRPDFPHPYLPQPLPVKPVPVEK